MQQDVFLHPQHFLLLLVWSYPLQTCIISLLQCPPFQHFAFFLFHCYPLVWQCVLLWYQYPVNREVTLIYYKIFVFLTHHNTSLLKFTFNGWKYCFESSGFWNCIQHDHQYLLSLLEVSYLALAKVLAAKLIFSYPKFCFIRSGPPSFSIAPYVLLNPKDIELEILCLWSLKAYRTCALRDSLYARCTSSTLRAGTTF